MKFFILFAPFIVLQINDAIAAYWVHASNGSIPATPPYPIRSGRDQGKVQFYTCRAWHNSDLVPGNLNAANGGCLIAYNGQEIKITEYDVAVGDGAYYSSVGTNFNLPITSVEGGIVTSKLKLLYVCRANIEGTLLVGKLEDTKCWISYGGGERSFTFGTYDILTHENYVLIPI